MHLQRVLLIMSVILVAAIVARSPADDKKPTLSDDDKKYLNGLMKEFLFDPVGAERVTVKVIVRSVWASAGEATSDGWYVAGKGKDAGKVFFTDGVSIPAPAAMTRVDFVAVCKAHYEAQPNKGEDPDRTFGKMRRTAVGHVVGDDLAMAAWLHRLGQEELAAKALDAANQKKGDARARLRGELAWSAFAGMVHAYMVRADEEALMHGERLLRLYGEESKSREFRQAAQVVAELKRRKEKGTFGKSPPEKLPDDFAKWETAKKVSYLIDALEEVSARQDGQPGGVDLASDQRVEQLIEIGDAAVPALIDALAKDRRLTRSVHFWRDFAHSRTVLSVQEAVLTALMSILRVQTFEPASTGDNFTARGEEAAQEMAKRLRAYWKEYGGLPFDERMMKILTDPKSSFDARREAADNLATLTAEKRLRTTIRPVIIGPPAPPRANPAIAKFSKPTAAEAILAAMDAELKAYDGEPAKERRRDRRQIEGAYLSAIVELGDERLAPEFAKRTAAATNPRDRRIRAHVTHLLGDARPFAVFADDFRAGKIELPANDEGGQELESLVGAFIGLRTAEGGKALEALSDAKHRYHKTAAQRMLNEQRSSFDESPWFRHPFCLRILRSALDDTTPTGYTIAIEEKSLRRKKRDGWSGNSIPDFLSDPAVRRDSAEERLCDAAAEKLGELVPGLPRCHPLFKDADARLATMKATLDRFSNNLRRATGREAEILARHPWNPIYMPEIQPLGRAATADDVKAGNAIFHLNGKGLPADVKLPARATLKRHQKAEDPPRLLILQAEVNSEDGRLTFGVIGRDGIRSVAADELIDIKTFEELEQEDRDAAERRKKE